MRMEWIDDILAVLDSGSLARAAEKRALTQSAFTRRVRLIEDSIGAELFDRRRKPVTLMAGVEALAPELRDLSLRMRTLRSRLKAATSHSGGAVSFACQHAITTTVSPLVVRALTGARDASVRVRSCNRDEGMMLLLSGEVDFAVMYSLPGEQTAHFSQAFEDLVLGCDPLVPVCAPSLQEVALSARIPGITYPSTVFLGKVFDTTIAPQLAHDINIVTKAETALTLAAYEFALSGIGVAWLPRSLVAQSISQGLLVSLAHRLPVQPLEIRAFRLAEGQSAQSDGIWYATLPGLDLNAHLQRFA